MEEFNTPNPTPTVAQNIREQFFENAGINIDNYNLKINLASGTDYLDGWINIDGSKNVEADIYMNLDSKDIELPFEDGYIDFIYAAHILEHIWYLPQLQAEMMRVLAPGGALCVIVPHYMSVDAWGDPTHCRAFSPASFYGLFWPEMGKCNYREYGVQAEKQTDGNNRVWIVCIMIKGEKENG